MTPAGATGGPPAGPQGAATAKLPGNQNRVSKQNLREAAGSGGNLKEYGMSIITGGTTKPGSSGGLGAQN